MTQLYSITVSAIHNALSLDADHDNACCLQAVRHGVRNISNVAETAATLGFAPKHKQCQIHLQVTQNGTLLHAVYVSISNLACGVSTPLFFVEVVL